MSETTIQLILIVILFVVVGTEKGFKLYRRIGKGNDINYISRDELAQYVVASEDKYSRRFCDERHSNLERRLGNIEHGVERIEQYLYQLGKEK